MAYFLDKTDKKDIYQLGFSKDGNLTRKEALKYLSRHKAYSDAWEQNIKAGKSEYFTQIAIEQNQQQTLNRLSRNKEKCLEIELNAYDFLEGEDLLNALDETLLEGIV